MARPHYDEENFKMVFPTREEVLTEAYNVGWHCGYDINKYYPHDPIDLTDKDVRRNWEIGCEEGKKAMQHKHLTR